MAVNNRRTALVCLCWLAALVVVQANASFAENWPGFRGPTRQGISQEKDVPLEWSQTSNIVWKTPIPGEGWSSPIVFEDRLFVTAATDGGVSFRLLCLDRKNGTVLWDKEIFRQKAGHKQQFNSYASSTPVTDGQRVFVVAADGSIAGVSKEGNVVWTNRDVDFYSEHGLAVSPILYEELLIVAFDGSSSGPDTKLGWQKPWDQAVIMALDKNTGNVRWKGTRGLSRVAHVCPQILRRDGADQLISSAGDVVQGFDLETGRRIWTVSSPGEGVVPSVVIGEGLVFTASGFGQSTIRAVRTGGEGDVTDTHVAWESTQDVPKVPSMLYARPFLFLITEGGVAKCLRAATGEVVWRERLDPKYSASPVWAEGRIYFLSEKGTTTVIQAGPEFEIIARNELNEKCCASPAISQKQIFIRSEHNLFCIGAQDKGVRLIVRGDDIGSSHAANVACIRAYKEGIMTSVELMVPCAWFPEAVKMLNENPGLDVGVHVTLTSEWDNIKWRPLTAAPSLTDADGYFYPTIWRRQSAPAGTALREADWKIEEIEKEIRAQIELAKRKVPHVSHLSFHMGCSDWDPKVKEVCEKLAKQYNLYIVPSGGGVRMAGGFGSARTAEQRTEKFIEMLKGFKRGTYLFVDHPGLDTPEMRAIGHPGYEDVAQDRQAVTDVFTSARVRKAIDELGIKLLSYADLKNAEKK